MSRDRFVNSARLVLEHLFDYFWTFARADPIAGESFSGIMRVLEDFQCFLSPQNILIKLIKDMKTMNNYLLARSLIVNFSEKDI